MIYENCAYAFEWIRWKAISQRAHMAIALVALANTARLVAAKATGQDCWPGAFIETFSALAGALSPDSRTDLPKVLAKCKLKDGSGSVVIQSTEFKGLPRKLLRRNGPESTAFGRPQWPAPYA